MDSNVLSNEHCDILNYLSCDPNENEAHMFICHDVTWLEDNFNTIINLFHKVELLNIKEIEIFKKLIFPNKEFNLISNKNTNLKISENKNIILR